MKASLVALAVAAVGLALTVWFGAASAETRPPTCMLALSPAQKYAFTLNRGAKVTLRDCGVTANSASDPAAVFARESTLAAKRVCVPSGYVADLGGTFTAPQPCLKEADFLAPRYRVPEVKPCTVRGRHYSVGRFVFSPGTYCGWFVFDPGSEIVLKPGLYVIRGGGWIAGGKSLTGNGVTLHLADASILQFNPGVAVGLSAPLSGPYAGFVITETGRKADPKTPRWIAINAVKSLTLSGLVHLPTRDVAFNRESRLVGYHFALVANRIVFNETAVSVGRTR